MTQSFKSCAPLDLFFILLILLLNPITFCFQCDLQYYPPDSVLYAYLAQQLLNGDWSMVVLGTNHIDNGVFLPPLLPILMALFSPFTEDLYLTASLISKLLALGLLVIGYFIVRYFSNRLVALTACLLIPINAQFFQAVFSPLTESSFMFMMTLLCAAALYSLNNLPDMSYRKLIVTGLIIGMICTLSYFARQIGFFSYVFITLLLFFGWLSSRQKQSYLVLWCSVVVGSAVLLTPYLLTTWSSTGELPTKQHFRQYQYFIETSDPAVLEERQALASKTREGDRYDRMLERRRDYRKLTPDSREMLSSVSIKTVAEQTTQKSPNQLGLLKRLWKSPKNLPRYFKANLVHLDRSFGRINFILFLLTCITPLLIVSTLFSRLQRMTIPLLVFSYLLCQSMFSGFAERYVIVLFPLMTLHIASELYQLWARFRLHLSELLKPLVAICLLGGASVLHAASHPFLFTHIKVEPKIVPLHRLFPEFRSTIDSAPVFSTNAYSGWLAGGKTRMLPNDSLEKIAKYGKFTGVKWLLVDQNKDAAKRSYYANISDWYQPGRIDQKYPDLIRFCCQATLPNGEGFFLYEFIQ